MPSRHPSPDREKEDRILSRPPPPISGSLAPHLEDPWQEPVPPDAGAAGGHPSPPGKVSREGEGRPPAQRMTDCLAFLCPSSPRPSRAVAQPFPASRRRLPSPLSPVQSRIMFRRRRRRRRSSSSSRCRRGRGRPQGAEGALREKEGAALSEGAHRHQGQAPEALRAQAGRRRSV